jgi:hypothetical protein
MVNLESFLQELKDKVNKIINNDFMETFNIDFDYILGELNELDYELKFSTPKITLKIDNQDNLKDNFNEAKLKLTSIAIFFALIKLEEEKTNSLKLLVLDDFLTSLDMANRKYIINYIIEEFQDYQKIILTHNLQFYNLIIKLLKFKNNKDWDIKNIYLNKDKIANIYYKNENYLEKAKEAVDNYNLEIRGNYQRKEFERIANEFEQLLEVGRVEELDNVIEALNNLDNILPKPNKEFKIFFQKLKNILNNNSNNNQIQQLRNEISNFEEKYNRINTSNLKNLISETTFYKDILMNSASHNDIQKDNYQKEFRNSIKILEKLNKLLKGLK